MRVRYIFSSLMLGLGLFASSCGDDAPPKSTIEFSADGGGSLEVSESNGNVSSFHPLLYADANGNTGTGVEYDIEINLNRPVAETTVIRFSTSGNATRSSATEVGDYDIVTDGDLLVIEKGESSAILTVVIFEDYDFEYTQVSQTEVGFYESFEIEFEEIIAGTGKIGLNTTYEVKINEDDALVYLWWDPKDYTCSTTDDGFGEPCEDDLDLIVWMNGDYLTKSASGSAFEGISIPAGFPNAQYGFSYTYYAGESANLDVHVEISNYGGKLNGSLNDQSYTTNYTLENINLYDSENGQTPYTAQTMNKTGFDYTVSAINKNPSGGSRVGKIKLQKNIAGKSLLQSVSRQTIMNLRRPTGL